MRLLIIAITFGSTQLAIWFRLFKTNDVLVNISLKFQTLISDICQIFLLKKCKKLLPCFVKINFVVCFNGASNINHKLPDLLTRPEQL